MYKGALTVCLALLLAACSPMYQEAPINCATAEREIKDLEAEKSYHVSYWDIDFGRILDVQIDEIKKTCGL